MDSPVSGAFARDFIGRVAESLAHADTLERLVRPLLELLEVVTGLESTYLTVVDEEAGRLHVLYARNSRQLQIAEGLDVPWSDTLCRRALEEHRQHVDDVATRWSDSAAARALGIATYMSTPVHTRDGSLYGTLCGASGESRSQVPMAAPVLEMFSRLIAQQIDRERMVRALREANDRLTVTANTDATTRLPNRRALLDEMHRRLAAAPDDQALLVAFIDLDGFKAINDNHGHDAGDRFLIAIGNRLEGTLREGDFVARLGGDEFVVLTDARRDMVEEASRAVVMRLQAATVGHYALDGLDLDYAGASVGVVVAEQRETGIEPLLARADAAMYAVKRQRRNGQIHRQDALAQAVQIQRQQYMPY